MLQHGILALRLFLTLTLLTGVVYPLAVTAIAQTLFAWRAGGSLVRVDGRVAGSELLAQKFTSTRYFWPRPSAAGYATMPSGASNLGWTSAQLKKTVAERRASLEPGDGSKAVPAELLFASASGLDPHISPEAAFYQLDRVATARGFDADHRQQLLSLISQKTEAPLWGFLGQPRINVLQLNLALDSLQ
jgi:K+-transporting ATPase ATPase C chain